MALADYQTLVDDMVRDDADHVSEDQRDRAIALAVTRYSTDRPKPAVEEMTAATDGSLQNLPRAWQAGFSTLERVELQSGGTPCEIDAQTVLTLDGEKIRLCRAVAAGDIFHMFHTVHHVLDEGNDTIPERDKQAVASWAASSLLEQLASLYSGMGNPTINADSVDWQSKGRDYASRARSFRKFYHEHLGVDPSRSVPAGAVADFDRGFSRGGDRLFHSQRRR